MKKYMNKKGAMLLIGLISSTALFAQGSGSSSVLGGYNILLILMFLFLVLVVAYLLKQLKFLSQFVSEETKKPSGKLTAWEKLNSFKPLDQEASLDVGHEYDGIRELDNVAPPWFTIGFAFTILFAGIYMYRYHIAKTAPLMIEEYEISVAKAQLEKEAFEKVQPPSVVDVENLALLGADDIEVGKQLFIRTCASCHANDGGGGAGPNLTDDYWIHGGSLKDIYVVIRDGYPEKAMPAWSNLLNPTQINQVTSFVKSLKGTTPANPKPPQGELYQEEAI